MFWISSFPFTRMMLTVSKEENKLDRNWTQLDCRFVLSVVVFSFTFFVFCFLFPMCCVACSIRYTVWYTQFLEREVDMLVSCFLYTYIHTICFFYSFTAYKKPRGDFFLSYSLLMSFQSSCCVAAFFSFVKAQQW